MQYQGIEIKVEVTARYSEGAKITVANSTWGSQSKCPVECGSSPGKWDEKGLTGREEGVYKGIENHGPFRNLTTIKDD